MVTDIRWVFWFDNKKNEKENKIMEWIQRLKPREKVFVIELKLGAISNTYTAVVLRFWTNRQVLIEINKPSTKSEKSRIVFDVASGQNIVTFGDGELGNLCLLQESVSDVEEKK